MESAHAVVFNPLTAASLKLFFFYGKFYCWLTPDHWPCWNVLSLKIVCCRGDAPFCCRGDALCRCRGDVLFCCRGDAPCCCWGEALCCCRGDALCCCRWDAPFCCLEQPSPGASGSGDRVLHQPLIWALLLTLSSKMNHSAPLPWCVCVCVFLSQQWRVCTGTDITEGTQRSHCWNIVKHFTKPRNSPGPEWNQSWIGATQSGSPVQWNALKKFNKLEQPSDECLRYWSHCRGQWYTSKLQNSITGLFLTPMRMCFCTDCQYPSLSLNTHCGFHLPERTLLNDSALAG